jgi:hypothetical protein
MVIVAKPGEELLERELAWLASLVMARMERLLRDGEAPTDLSPVPLPPPLPGDDQRACPWALLVAELEALPPGTPQPDAAKQRATTSGRKHLAQPASSRLASPAPTSPPTPLPLPRLALALLLAAELRPQALEPLQLRHPALERRYSDVGGVEREALLEPTGATLAFLADGGGLAGQLAVLRLLGREGPLQRLGVLAPLEGPSPLRGGLRLAMGWLEWLAGAGPRPEPEALAAGSAQRLTTAMAWADLVLPAGTLRQLEEIEQHLEHRATLLEEWGMGRRLRPGYRALFHGPPGTGKTLTATLLGARLGLEVRRVDLSQAVSKYIGETEKNLAALLDRAEHSPWLLLFDEADALFGQRSETRDAHDRYANQEIAYLLQRLETFSGVVILATNQPTHLDGAFLRRFESVVYFPLPGPEQRLRLWREAFSPRARLAVDLEVIAAQHELSGGLILNVVRQVSLQAIASGDPTIAEPALLRAIRRELEKEGKGL